MQLLYTSLSSDIDECVEGTHRCTNHCHNTIGSYECSCDSGYQLNPDENTCDDIDECNEEPPKCDQRCHNTKGGYTCSCEVGYRLSTDGFTCVGESLFYFVECHPNVIKIVITVLGTTVNWFDFK